MTLKEYLMLPDEHIHLTSEYFVYIHNPEQDLTILPPLQQVLHNHKLDFEQPLGKQLNLNVPELKVMDHRRNFIYIEVTDDRYGFVWVRRTYRYYDTENVSFGNVTMVFNPNKETFKQLKHFIYHDQTHNQLHRCHDLKELLTKMTRPDKPLSSNQKLRQNAMAPLHTYIETP